MRAMGLGLLGYCNPLDNQTAATNFRNELKVLIDGLAYMPMGCGESIFFDDESMGDFIYKGLSLLIKLNLVDWKYLVFGAIKIE